MPNEPTTYRPHTEGGKETPHTHHNRTGEDNHTYLFVVIFLPLTILVEVETDLKLPIPLPPNVVEENEVRPP